MLKEDNELFDRRHHNSEVVPEKRGCSPILLAKDLERCNRFLQDLGWSARSMTWSQLANELDFDCSGHTLKDYIGSMDYHKCIACSKGWVLEKLVKRRKE
jgi:hypothetical protein